MDTRLEQIRFENYSQWKRARANALSQDLGTIAMTAITSGLLFPGHTEYQPAAYQPSERQRRTLGHMILPHEVSTPNMDDDRVFSGYVLAA